MEAKAQLYVFVRRSCETIKTALMGHFDSFFIGNTTAGVFSSFAEDALCHARKVLDVLLLACMGRVGLSVASKLYVLLGARCAFNASKFLQSSKLFIAKHVLKLLCLLHICYKAKYLSGLHWCK